MTEPAAVYRRRRLTAAAVAAGVTVAAVLALRSCGSPARRASAARVPDRPLVVNLPRGGRRIFPAFRVVAYYGAPQDAQLGELGIGTPAHAARKLLRQA